MTLEQIAAQVLWCGWSPDAGAAPGSVTGYNEHARYLVEELQVGGLILFARNVGSPDAVAALTEQVRERAAARPLLSIDQEGGRVCRLALPGTVFPGNMALGALDDPSRTRAAARAQAEQLAALGIDVNFAPVLDVNNNPDNPIIGVRSFGQEPERVARHGVAAVEGFRDAGILPVVKHFPGHGDTGTDSHLELPVQPAARRRLEEVELLPFRAALAAGAPAVMTTHILFPALDPDLPSTLSPRVLTGLLRGEMGFGGLITTDCMEMQGIAAHWGPEEAAVLALRAGADVLLVSHTRETQVRMHAALCAAVRSGALPEERLREAAGRVAAARGRTDALHARPPDPGRVGTAAYRDLEAELAEACLALATESPAEAPQGSAPLSALSSGWGLADCIAVSGAPIPAERMARALREAGGRAETVPPEALERLRKAPRLVWLVPPDRPFPGTASPEEILRLLANHPAAIVVAAREPYPLARYPTRVPRLVPWGTEPPHLRAAARWLLGIRSGPLLRTSLHGCTA